MKIQTRLLWPLLACTVCLGLQSCEFTEKIKNFVFVDNPKTQTKDENSFDWKAYTTIYDLNKKTQDALDQQTRSIKMSELDLKKAFIVNHDLDPNLLDKIKISQQLEYLKYYNYDSGKPTIDVSKQKVLTLVVQGILEGETKIRNQNVLLFKRVQFNETNDSNPKKIFRWDLDVVSQADYQKLRQIKPF
jgi:hypothetical protein